MKTLPGRSFSANHAFLIITCLYNSHEASSNPFVTGSFTASSKP